MQTEIEVKFVNVDIDDVRQRLKAAGATLEHPLRLMRRVIIEQPEHRAEHSFIRVRDEGDRTTLTFKRRKTMDIAKDAHNTQELEVVVSDFDDTVEIFKEAGWPPISYQESKRETWQLDGTEIVIDVWPWISPYIEIEAETEEAVKVAARALGFSWEAAFYGRIEHVYRLEYDIDPSFQGPIDLKELTFDMTIPAEFKKK
ncbi:CYTH domain-containing protein [Candidatus Saccharibacteria bacterium]|nr:CYTH domain-containing protein [Candidatus Saccharibacteria bacterium]